MKASPSHWAGERGKEQLHALATYQVTSAVPGPRTVYRASFDFGFELPSPESSIVVDPAAAHFSGTFQPLDFAVPATAISSGSPPVVTLDGPREVRRVAFTSAKSYSGSHVQLFRLDQQQLAPKATVSAAVGGGNAASGLRRLHGRPLRDRRAGGRTAAQRDRDGDGARRRHGRAARHRRPGRSRLARVLLADARPDRHARRRGRGVRAGVAGLPCRQGRRSDPDGQARDPGRRAVQLRPDRVRHRDELRARRVRVSGACRERPHRCGGACVAHRARRAIRCRRTCAARSARRRCSTG